MLVIREVEQRPGQTGEHQASDGADDSGSAARVEVPPALLD